MKKIFILAAAAMMCMASCSKDANSAAKTADKDSTATEAVATDATPAGKVIECDNDSTYRPGMTVDALTVLDFNAVWCGPCKQLTPVFEEAATMFTDVKFVSIDIDKLPMTAQAFGVESIPTVVFIKPDGTSTTYVGTQDLLPAETFDKLVRDNK